MMTEPEHPEPQNEPDAASSEDDTQITHDSFLDGQVQICQPRHGYRVGTDAVVLAATIQNRSGRLLDMGAGAGGVSLAVLNRHPGCSVTAVEKDQMSFDLLEQNIALNGHQKVMRAVRGDVLALPPMLKASFDHVFSNPPFHHPGDRPARNKRRTLAHYGDGADLSDWAASALWAARHKGRVSFIIRADRTDELIIALKAHGAGEVLLCPVWSHQSSPATRMVVTARKGVKGAMAMLPGLVLHHRYGALTKQAEQVMKGDPLILRHPANRHLSR